MKRLKLLLPHFKKDNLMRILYVTDLHGNIPKYNKIFDIAKELKVGAVVNGGDLYPKNIDLHKQGQFITGFFDSYLQKFEKINIPYLLIPGNDDLKTFDGLLQDICNQYKNIFLIQKQKIELNGYEFIGFDLVADYPFRLKDRCRRDADYFVFPKQFGKGLLSTPIGFDEIDDWIKYSIEISTLEDELTCLPTPNNIDKTIYIIHMPPSKLGLDVCSDWKKVGSDSVYNFIKQKQPMLSLHGHIHESVYMTRVWESTIGKTTCIQPGQMNSLTYVTIDLDTMKTKFVKS